MTLALLLFAATYLLMLRLQQYRPWVALCSAVLFIVLGEVGVYGFSLRAALQAVDYNVLLMMAGTMGTVALFIESKMPARLAEMLIVRVPDVKRAVCMRWRCSPASSVLLWTMWLPCSWWPRWALPLPAS